MPRPARMASASVPRPYGLADRCSTCQKSWPAMNFSKGQDTQATPGVCLRCGSLELERDIWKQHYAEMAKRIAQARKKEPERAERYRQTISAHGKPSANPQRALRLLLEASQWPPREKAQVADQGARSVITVPASFVDMGSNTPQTASAGSSTGPGTSGGSKTFGVGSIGDGAGLSPLGIRILDEPHRAIVWLQCNYVARPGSSIPQSTLFRHYISSMILSRPLSPDATALTNTEIDEAYQISGQLRGRIPDLLKGADLMNLIISQFRHVKMVREGWLCAGIAARPREMVEIMERAVSESVHLPRPGRGPPSADGSATNQPVGVAAATWSGPLPLGIPHPSVAVIPLYSEQRSQPEKPPVRNPQNQEVSDQMDEESDIDHLFSFAPPGSTERV